MNKKPLKRTKRGAKYETLAEGYRIMKSPLAETFDAAAEHFEKDQSGGGNDKSGQQKPLQDDS